MSKKLLYCLKCKTNGRFYVGQTPVWRLAQRWDEHVEGSSRWTKRHGVSGIVWTKVVSERDADYLEDLEVSKIMAKHGWNSCRGGLFNLAADVSEMPGWVQPQYRERKSAIDAASKVCIPRKRFRYNPRTEQLVLLDSQTTI